MNTSEYTKEFNRIYHLKPTISVMAHVEDMKEIEITLSDVKGHVNGSPYRALSIEDISIFMTENQAEQVFKTLERGLYEETFAELEEKYLTERVRRKHLEEELELLKERLREVV